MKKFAVFLKRLTVNTLTTTALSILLVCFIQFLFGARLWGVTVPFEMLLANFLLHIGFYLIQRFDFKYYLLKHILQLLFLMCLLTGIGFLFNWYEGTPLWIVCLSGALVYAAAAVIDVISVKKQVDEINGILLELRKNDDESNMISE